MIFLVHKHNFFGPTHGVLYSALSSLGIGAYSLGINELAFLVEENTGELEKMAEAAKLNQVKPAIVISAYHATASDKREDVAEVARKATLERNVIGYQIPPELDIYLMASEEQMPDLFKELRQAGAVELDYALPKNRALLTDGSIEHCIKQIQAGLELKENVKPYTPSWKASDNLGPGR